MIKQMSISFFNFYFIIVSDFFLLFAIFCCGLCTGFCYGIINNLLTISLFLLF